MMRLGLFPKLAGAACYVECQPIEIDPVDNCRAYKPGRIRRYVCGVPVGRRVFRVALWLLERL